MPTKYRIIRNATIITWHNDPGDVVCVIENGLYHARNMDEFSTDAGQLAVEQAIASGADEVEL